MKKTDPLMTPSLHIRLRLMQGQDIALGPGKADLLDGIAATGSISAAARRMGMSYRRAWLLVDTMNRCFKQVLVEASTGGAHGGGAHLTDLGSEVLSHYRKMETALHRVAMSKSIALRSLIGKTNVQK